MITVGSSSSQYRSKEESCDFSYQAALDDFCADSGNFSGGECDLSRSEEWSKTAKDSINQNLTSSIHPINTNISSSTNTKNNSNNTNTHIVDQKVRKVSATLTLSGNIYDDSRYFKSENQVILYFLSQYEDIKGKCEELYLDLRRESFIKTLLELEDAIKNGHQFKAFAALEILLKIEETKQLLNTTFKDKFNTLIKMANKNQWRILEAILQCNADTTYFNEKVLHNRSNGKICMQNDDEKAIMELNLPSDFRYPLFQKEFVNSGDNFLHFVSTNINKIKEDRVKTIVQTYPLFISEERLLGCFMGFDPKHDEKGIVKIFKELVRNGFIERTDMSEKGALKELHRKFKKTKKIVKKYHSLEKAEKKSKGAHSIVKNAHMSLDPGIWNMDIFFSQWNANELAEAFTARDAQLIAAIKYEDIRNWLQNGGPQPESVVKLENACQTTIQGIAFEIISKYDSNIFSEFDSNICKNLISQFVVIRKILLETQNFHSASLITQALNLPVVQKVIENNGWPFGLFLENPRPAEIEATLLAVDQGFWEGLKKAYDGCVITDATKYAQTLNNFRKIDSKQANCGKKGAFLCISNLQAVPFQSLDELYYFIHTKEFLQHYSKIEMAEWNTAYLASFLYDHENGNGPAMLKKLFGMGIYSGEQLLEAFSKDKEFIENWPVSMKIKMWGEYLSHLSPISLYEMQ